MTAKITLFEQQTDKIKISMELYFETDGSLKFDGYDIGEDVKKTWGDSDYEYTYTIQPHEVKKLYTLCDVPEGNQAALLETLKEKFGHNNGYSEMGDFMKEHGVIFETFSWA